MGNFSRLFSKQLPRFIIDDYPQFVLFIEKFFEFMEENTFIDKNIHNLSREYSGVQTFLEAIKKEVAYNLPRPVVDEATLLTKIKQLYVSKGSEESLKFLFKVFFNRDVEIFLPSSQIFKPSEGEWNQEYSVFVKKIVGDPFITEGKRVSVLTRQSNVSLDVLRVNQTLGESTTGAGGLDLGYVTELLESMIELGLVTEDILSTIQLPAIGELVHGDYFELIIDRNYSGSYRVGDLIQFSNDTEMFLGYIVPTLSRVEVLRGGKGFKLGQTLDIEDDVENDSQQVVLSGRGVRLKVSKLGADASIQSAQLIRFGVEYPRSLYVTISSNPLRVVSKTLFHTNKIDMDLEDRIIRYENKGYLLSDFEYAANHGCVINYEILNQGSNYTTATATVEISPGVTAELTPVIVDNKIVDFIITNRGLGYVNPLANITISGDGTGAIARAIIGSLNYNVLEYVGNMKGNFASLMKYNYEPPENMAILKLVSGPVAKYPGYYVDNKSFISDSIALIDSKYYQNFSYVIRTDIPYDDYVGAVTSITHPSGYKMFGEYILKNDLTSKVTFVDMTRVTYNVVFTDTATVFDEPVSFFTPVYPAPIIFNDSIQIDEGICLYDNPYSVPVGYVDGYFGEDYTSGNTCIIVDENPETPM